MTSVIINIKFFFSTYLKYGAHLAKYTNIINLEEVTERNINRKSFLEALSIALRKVELTRPTVIQGYIERILPTEEYNSTEQFVKDHRPVLKELGVKNKVQLHHLLFTFAALADEYEVSMKNYIKKTIQVQVAQFESTELANDMPVSTQAQPMETEIFENVEHQLMDVEHDDQNIEHQSSEDVIAESSTKNSKKSFTKLNAKATPYTPKGKDALSRLQKWPPGI
ncbi:unnamed protein product [Rhizophagus irregularis]|nr:unnamed protein product [Rhizophagus irregularis]